MEAPVFVRLAAAFLLLAVGPSLLAAAWSQWSTGTYSLLPTLAWASPSAPPLTGFLTATYAVVLMALSLQVLRSPVKFGRPYRRLRVLWMLLGVLFALESALRFYIVIRYQPSPLGGLLWVQATGGFVVPLYLWMTKLEQVRSQPLDGQSRDLGG